MRYRDLHEAGLLEAACADSAVVLLKLECEVLTGGRVMCDLPLVQSSISSSEHARHRPTVHTPLAEDVACAQVPSVM
jgi:hypothetical protein